MHRHDGLRPAHSPHDAMLCIVNTGVRQMGSGGGSIPTENLESLVMFLYGFKGFEGLFGGSE